jgi:hypothetical protein
MYTANMRLSSCIDDRVDAYHFCLVMMLDSEAHYEKYLWLYKPRRNFKAGSDIRALTHFVIARTCATCHRVQTFRYGAYAQTADVVSSNTGSLYVLIVSEHHGRSII